MRRTIVSAQLEQARRSGELNSNAGALLQAVLSAKGGGARYQETLMHRLNASGDAQLIACRQELRQLEDQIAALPQTLTDVNMFMQLSAMHGLLISQASAALCIAALDTIDIATLQSRRGSNAVIGFFMYAPPAAQSFAPAPPHYLRYCLHATGVTLRDLGSQATLEQGVHRYRSELIIDPDAALHLLPFDALPDADGSPLVLSRQCRHVSSLRQLLPRDEPAGAATPGPAAILAAPAYGAGLAQPLHATMRFAASGDSDRQRSAWWRWRPCPRRCAKRTPWPPACGNSALPASGTKGNTPAWTPCRPAARRWYCMWPRMPSWARTWLRMRRSLQPTCRQRSRNGWTCCCRAGAPACCCRAMARPT